jgi:uncharacterized membrane protein AbrB (regulator of aidB expression)
MRWRYFLPAAFFGGYLLLSNGVPLLPVLSGCAIAALCVWLRQNSGGTRR